MPVTQLAPHAQKLSELDIKLASIHDFAKCRSHTLGYLTYTHRILGSDKVIKYYRGGGYYTKDLATAKALEFNYLVKKILPVFRNKEWKDPKNKALLDKIATKQLNILPASLHCLDKYGFNHLEIINLVPLIGRTVTTMPTGDVDFLNVMQEKHEVVFNLEHKAKGKGFKLSDVSGNFRNKADKSYPQFSFVLYPAY